MLLQIWLLLVALTALTFGVNPGVKVSLTQKSLEFGRVIGMVVIQHKLKTIQLPDMSGKEKLSPIGSVEYTIFSMVMSDVGLPQSAVSLAPGAGVRLSIGNAYMSLNGKWKVKYMKFIKDRGTFDLDVSGLSVTTTIAISSDGTGRPVVSGTNCAASVDKVRIKFHGGASWLYNLFDSFINKAIRKALEKQICPLVADAISDINPYFKTLNVLAQVDEYAEIEYSMLSPPVISTTSVEFGLKGEFYNIGKHQEPPFTPEVFSLPSQTSHMLYIGLSSFTANSAGFVYFTAGALSLYITDDMIPASSPIRLNTQTFGMFIPQIAQFYPGLLMKLLVKAAKSPEITFESDNATISATGTVTAFAIQVNGTLSPLFVLNMDGSVTAQMFMNGTRVAGSVSLNKVNLTLGTSYVGDFQVTSLDNIFQMVLKAVIIPKINAELSKGDPLPTIGKMKLVNTQLQMMKDYLLVGTDVLFIG